MPDNPRNGSRRGSSSDSGARVPANPYASAWECSLTDPALGYFNDIDIAVLRHVNCSYLSSDTAPTLEALKQHAQSLLYLIRKITDMATVGSVTGDREDRRLLFNSNEAFDLLVDLTTPYHNGDESHHLPLWAISNNIQQHHEAGHRCPLKPANKLGPLAAGSRPVRPYRDHHSLVMHANECLEILDEEYAGTGGLLSILPSDSEEDAEHLEVARGTLLGQWLLNHSYLVARTGEIELNHALVLDLLEREAVLPAQMLNRSSPNGKSKSREVADHQDRFVLADAGDDMFEMVHRIMDREEVAIEMKERLWKDSEVGGQRRWMKVLGSDFYTSGMVPVDMKTRFFRLRGQGGQTTIFIVPDVESDAAAAHAGEMENHPNVVSVASPTEPEGITELEKKYLNRLEDNSVLARENAEMKDTIAAQEAELRECRMKVELYEETMVRGERARCHAMMRQIMALMDELERVKTVPPEEYHQHLGMESRDGADSMACTDGVGE